MAVKVLHPHFTQTPGFVERFRHEAAAAGSLVHPRIIQVYDFDVSEGSLYYI
jgi:eukaryotic-like serine/threonine-protein kinase